MCFGVVDEDVGSHSGDPKRYERRGSRAEERTTRRLFDDDPAREFVASVELVGEATSLTPAWCSVTLVEPSQTKVISSLRIRSACCVG